MNKFYIERWIADRIRKGIDIANVVVITGARQVGKTTMIRNEAPFSNWVYHDMDDPDSRFMAEESPETLFEPDSVVIDEVQKVPHLLNIIKVHIDRHAEKKVVLSGSSNLLLMKRVSETLAGRAIFFFLQPFTFREWAELPPLPLFDIDDLRGTDCPEPPDDPNFWLMRGFLPRTLKLVDMKSVTMWWKAYIMTYLERDLRDLSNISSLVDFKKVMERLTLSVGSFLNETEVARDTGVSQPTVHRYINLLETSNIAFKVRGFYKSKSKRIAKRTKIYFFDSGLLAALSKFSIDVSKLLENYVFQALKAYSELLVPVANIYHWRTHNGYEVDFVFENKNRLLPIEVKAKKEVNARDFKNIVRFMREHPETEYGIIVYLGNTKNFLGDKFLALPWHCL